jgi:hypothetical protein
MTSRDFCYWLQGYIEIQSARTAPSLAMTEDQVKTISSHLNLVFVHEIDPSNVALGVPAQVAQSIHDQDKLQIGGTDSQGNVFRC